MRGKFLLLLLVLAPLPAQARCVLFEGDSITAPSASLYGTNGEWPKLVQALRPDIIPCNIARGGKNTLQSLTAIDSTIDWLKSVHGSGLKDGVILIGINNTIIARSVEDTALDILAIADHMAARGVTPHILTLTPALNFPWTNVWARDVSNAVFALNTLRPPASQRDVPDLRDDFTALSWTSCSTDAIHPAGLACRWRIANFVARAVPPQ